MVAPIIHKLEVDIRNEKLLPEPQVIKNDNVVFLLEIKDSNQPLDLTNITSYTLSYVLADRSSNTILGTKNEDGKIEFHLPFSAAKYPGQAVASVQLYEGNKRVSSLPFSYRVLKDRSDLRAFQPEERTMISLVLAEGPFVIQAAKQATEDAIKASSDLTTAVVLKLESFQQEKESALEEVSEAVKQANLSAENADRERERITEETTHQIDQMEKVSLSTVEVRNQTENVKVETEKVRKKTEDERLETEMVRTNTLQVLEATEAVRIQTETTKTEAAAAAEYATEQGDFAKEQGKAQQLQMGEVHETMEYISKDFVPSTSETIANMQRVVRESSSNSLEAQQKAANAENVAKNVRSEFDQVVAEAGSNNPEIVNARGTHATLKKRLDSTDQKLEETARETQLLQNGLNVLNADVATPVDFEIAGRTLTSLANSNLEANKYYVLADKKTKIGVDGKTVSGVGKFQKQSTTVTVADFKGKVIGSDIANPHIFGHLHGTTTFPAPSGFVENAAPSAPSGISSLDGTTVTSGRLGASGEFAKQLFSFNVVAQIERQLGLIPKNTLSEKAQWIRENVNFLRVVWYGFGISSGSNKSSLKYWNPVTSSWVGYDGWSHTNSTVTSSTISFNTVDLLTKSLGADGFVHILAHSEPSSGNSESNIHTDYVKLDIELKPTAQLNTRGKIIVVDNFEGKVVGSKVENPHYASYKGGTVIPDNKTGVELSQTTGYDRLSTLNGDVTVVSSPGAGTIGSHTFTFNLIEMVERKVGKIPAVDLTGKVAWIRKNVFNFTISWHGFGIGPNGNMAKVKIWDAIAKDWGVLTREITSNEIRSAKFNRTSFYNDDRYMEATNRMIDSEGCMSIIAYAEPSDGVTNSAIRTDYVEMEIELRQDADFHNPKVPLYEVTAEEYGKIGIEWDENAVMNRFPVVEGTQHLVNPYVMAEGENLFKTFYEGYTFVGGTVESDVEFISPYEMRFKPTGATKYVVFNRDVTPNQNYSVSSELTNTFIAVFDETGSTNVLPYSGNSAARVFNSGNRSKIRIYFYVAGNQVEGIFKNPMLTLGSTPKPFTPYNPSYLFTETKLGAIGNSNDTLFRQDGQWKRRKVVDNVDITGKTGFTSFASSSSPDFKSAVLRPGTLLNSRPKQYTVISNKGDILKISASSATMEKDNAYIDTNGNLIISVDNKTTGFTQSSSPTTEDWNRYFNGWKYTDGTTWVSVTGNGQNATAQQSLDTKPTDYTPYKLSYVLATPVIDNVNVEGEIVADGLTQVEVRSGVIVREKATPATYASSTNYWIALDATATSASRLKNRVEKFISVYKNGEVDNKWRFSSYPNSQGKVSAQIPIVDFDATAEYTVTYLAEKPKLTVNPVDLKATFAKNIRSAVDDLANRFGDAATRLSIVERAVVDFYVKLKALGAK